MKLEHVAINVENAAEAAKWYAEHLGMTIVKSNDEEPYIHFLADSAGKSLLEFYTNPAAPVPDYASMHPVVLHIAFEVDDLEGERDRLIRAGATEANANMNFPNGDRLVMVRDPWGVCIQLAKRVKPIL